MDIVYYEVAMNIPSIWLANDIQSHGRMYRRIAAIQISQGVLTTRKCLHTYEDLDDLQAGTDASLKTLEVPDREMGVNYHSISKCYSLRFQRLGKDEDLEEAIKWARQALDTKTTNETFRSAYAHQQRGIYKVLR